MTIWLKIYRGHNLIYTNGNLICNMSRHRDSLSAGYNNVSRSQDSGKWRSSNTQQQPWLVEKRGIIHTFREKWEAAREQVHLWATGAIELRRCEISGSETSQRENGKPARRQWASGSQPARVARQPVLWSTPSRHGCARMLGPDTVNIHNAYLHPKIWREQKDHP